MSDSNSPGQRPSSKAPLFMAITLLAVIALAVYFEFGRQRGPRHLKLALVTWTEDPFWEPLLQGAKDYADSADIELTIIKSKPDADVQTQHIQTLLASGVDGIALSPNDANAQRTILEEVTSKIPVVTFDTDAPESKRKRFVGIDNYAAGRFCASELSEAMPKGGPVLISVGSTTMQHGRDRRQGVIDELLGRGIDRNRPADPMDVVLKGPKFTVVCTATDGGVPTKAVDSIEAALRAHPEVKGIIGLFSYSAPAALEAIKRVGRTDQIQIVGFDSSPETQAALKAGTIHSSVIQDTYRCGYDTIEVLANEARGIPRGPAEQSVTYYVGTNVLTDKNLFLLENPAKDGPFSGSSNANPAGR